MSSCLCIYVLCTVSTAWIVPMVYGNCVVYDCDSPPCSMNYEPRPFSLGTWRARSIVCNNQNMCHYSEVFKLGQLQSGCLQLAVLIVLQSHQTSHHTNQCGCNLLCRGLGTCTCYKGYTEGTHWSQSLPHWPQCICSNPFHVDPNR